MSWIKNDKDSKFVLKYYYVHSIKIIQLQYNTVKKYIYIFCVCWVSEYGRRKKSEPSSGITTLQYTINKMVVNCLTVL